MGNSKKTLKSEKLFKDFVFGLKVMEKIAEELGEEAAMKNWSEFGEKFLKQIKISGMVTISNVSDLNFVEKLMGMGYGGAVRLSKQLEDAEKDVISDRAMEKGIFIKADPKP